MRLEDRVVLANGYTEDGQYPAAMVNITNRCNLECPHCFIYRDGNPNDALSPRLEPTDEEMLETLAAVRDRHGIGHMMWMGGEPLLRKKLLTEGVKLFASNTVTTNGTLPLVDLGPDVLYVVSLDGPEKVNDAVRGDGTFRRVMKRLDDLPDDFSTPIQAQCTVTPANQDHLGELVEAITDTRFGWMTFSFLVPCSGDYSEAVWPDLESRMVAVDAVRRVKDEYPAFVRNRSVSLDLMAPDQAPAVVADCLTRQVLLPLWLDGDRFTTPFCCYGDDVDCERCGAWVVFDLASRRKEWESA